VNRGGSVGEQEWISEQGWIGEQGWVGEQGWISEPGWVGERSISFLRLFNNFYTDEHFVHLILKFV